MSADNIIARGNPTFIGIGAEKSATTWCWACLDEHPDVCMAHPKEVNYFNSNYERGREWYLGHFAHAERKIVGEISPLYMDDADACRRIKSDFPDVIILAVLRNPYERALSHLLMDSQTETGGVSDITADLLAETAARDDKYVRRSLYYRGLSPYVERFGRERVRILFYEDLRADAGRFVRTLYDAVGADADFLPAVLGKTINKTRDYKYPVLFNWLRSLSQTARATPGGKHVLEWIHRKTKLRERVFDLIQVDRGRPEFGFDEIFSADARSRIADDMRLLTTALGIKVPSDWQESDNLKR